MGEWLTPLLAFVGGALGAAGAFWAAQRDRSQRQEQGRREEWGRRFSIALEEVSSEDPRSRELGRVLLVELASSHLATSEERELAKRILDAGARIDADGEDATALAGQVRGAVVDEVEFVEDDGVSTNGGPR